MSSPPHEPDFVPTAEARLRQRSLAIWHLLEITHLRKSQQASQFTKIFGAPDDGPRGPAVISPRGNRASLAIQGVFGNYTAGFGF